MSLLEARKQFVRATGRYDLVSGPVLYPMDIDHASNNYTDRGANYFLAAGQRMLDRMLEYQRQATELSYTLATNAMSLNLPGNVRSVKGVVVQDDADDEQFNAIKKDLRWLRWKYGSDVATLASVAVGEPIYYAPGFLRVEAPTTGNSSTEVKRKLVLMPPADKQYTIVVEVDLKSSLVNDTDVSWWSEEELDVLVSAARYKLEIDERNREGARLFLEEVQFAVDRISADLTAEEAADTVPYTNTWDYIDDQDSIAIREVS